MEMAATTASSLEVEQDSGNINKTQSMATLNGSSITATIYRKVKITVSEGSIRMHLKLEDSEGIPSFPTAEIFEQLALMSAPSTSQPPIMPTEEPAPMPYESPLHSVHSLGCDEGNMQQHELMDLVTKLTDRIDVLEKDLQQTKKTCSTAPTRLILRVKKLEKTIKTSKARRRARVVLSEDEDVQDMEYDFDVSTSEGFTTATLELQKQLDEREKVATKEAHDIDWSDPSVLRYHALQNRHFSVAEVMKNMCMYLKNQGGYKMSHFKGMSYEEIRPIFKRVWDQT
ncbi:hypothetical protein Tco_1424409 [Tanacetum coccineum]